MADDMTKDELKEMAEEEGVEVAPGDTKADIVEKLEAAAGGERPAAPYDPNNPGGVSFDYGTVEATDSDFDPDNPGGQVMDVPGPEA